MRRWLGMVLLTSCAPSPDFGCGGTKQPCTVPLGSYVALMPPSWRQGDTLPAFVHFHGHSGTAEKLADKDVFTKPMAKENILAVYPDGTDGSWGFSQGWPSGRDELDFVDQVIADATARFPVDPERVVVSGFSIGGSMVWDALCDAPERAVAFAPVSGTLWNPLPPTCAPGTVRVRQEHGTSDGTFPLAGRTLGAGAAQGDSRKAFAMLAETHGCSQPSTRPYEMGECTVWDDCEDGSELQLCIHSGGHSVQDGWHGRTLDFLR